MSEASICPLCSTTLAHSPRAAQNLDAEYIDCPQCGKYLLDGYTKTDSRVQESKHLISAWIRNQHKLGNEWPIVAVRFEGPELGIFDAIKQLGIPKGTNEKLDALILAYSDIVQDDYSKIIKVQLYPYLIPEVAVKNYGDIWGLNELLYQLGYIKKESSGRDANLTITANGWKYIDYLRNVTADSNSAFIAMWYDDCTNEYRKAIIAAVEYCGYKPLIIDSVEFNDFIMDEVVNLIKQSRFLISDLTCLPEDDNPSDPKVKQGVRGGVYWESGFAYGLGKPVIQTCKKDDCSKRRVHFDLDQYTTIYWEDNELNPSVGDLDTPLSSPNFAERVANRILATVGKSSS